MMRNFSFRWIAPALVVAACGAVSGMAGCQRITNARPLSLSPPAMQVDEAMQARDWNPVNADYANGSTVAGPTGFLYTAKKDQPSYHYAALDVPIFMVDTALLPYAFSQTPPWAAVQWKGDTVEPTYTAVPPLPAE